MTIIKLTKPIEAYGEKVTEINLREPTGADLQKTGAPFKTSEEEGITFQHIDMAIVGKLIVQLGNLPAGSVGTLSLPDFLACSRAINAFFGVSAATPTSSIDSTT
jgi:hypothetical protein